MTAERPEPIEEYGTDALPIIPESEDEETVVPVRIIESGRARELRAHRGWNMTVRADGRTVEVVGGNEDRRRLYVFNTSQAPAPTLDPPVLDVVTADVGGTIPAAQTYRAIITALNENGETTGSNEVTVTTGATATNTITWSWTEVPGATHYRLYVTDLNGVEGTEEFHREFLAGTLSYLRTSPPGNFNNRNVPITNTAFITASLAGHHQVYLLDNQGASSFMGYPLSPLSGVELFSEGAVYVVNLGDEDIVLAIHDEFSIPEL